MSANFMKFWMKYSAILNNEEYCQLKTNKERQTFILSHKPLDEIRAEFYQKIDYYRFQHMKNSEKSVQHIYQGLNYFSSGEYSYAIIEYNKAILSAPFPSETDFSQDLSIAYALRSDTHFALEDYSMALFDANQSLSCCDSFEVHFQKVHCLQKLSKFSEALEEIDKIMIKMKEQSIENNSFLMDLNELKQEIQNNSSDINVVLNDVLNGLLTQVKTTSSSAPEETTTATDPNYQYWLHPSCELRESEDKGRYLGAKEEIPKKTVILIEQPYSVVLFGNAQFDHCLNCSKQIGAQFWPCNGCDEVVFCDEECLSKAYDRFHKYECGFTGYMHETSAGSQHSYRIMSRIGVKNAINYQKSGQMFDFAKEMNEKHSQPPMESSEMDEKTKEELQRRYEFKAFAALKAHESELMPDYIKLYHSVVGIEFALLFEYTQQIGFDSNPEGFQSFLELADLCVQNFNRVQINVFGWFLQSNPMRTHIGNAVCNFGSLINHSCEPNIHWEFKDQKLHFIAKEDISAGAEVNITYGPTVKTQRYVDRQKKLKRNYRFDCRCEGCLREANAFTPKTFKFRCPQCSHTMAQL